MARQSGIFNFEGTLDNVTFYKTADGLLVRKKGGISKQRIKTDAAFVRTRENGAEFGNCAKSGSKIRQAISPMVHKAKDSKLSSRLIKICFAIKKMDAVNIRGERNVGQGLTTPAGKAALKDFDFNQNAKFHTVLSAPYSLDVATGSVSFTDLNPLENINFPDGATHFSLQTALLHLDLTAGTSEAVYSPLLNVPGAMLSNFLTSEDLSHFFSIPPFLPNTAVISSNSLRRKLFKSSLVSISISIGWFFLVS